MINLIMYKILFLLPDAKFCVKAGMTESDLAAAANSNETVYPIGNLFILWSSLNVSPFPGVDAINAVTDNQANQAMNRMLKLSRNMIAKQNLAIVAAFKLAKQANPLLRFGDYLDGLEVDAGNINPNDMA